MRRCWSLKNAKIYTITNGIVDGSVLVDDEGRITAVGEVEIPEPMLRLSMLRAGS
jgi:hypothetical protein